MQPSTTPSERAGTSSTNFSAEPVMLRADVPAFLITGAVAFWFRDMVDPPVMRDVLGIVVQIGGTLMGFVVAAMAILMALPDSRFTANLRRTGHMQKLLNQMFWAAGWALAIIISGVAVMFTSSSALPYCAALVLAVMGATVARLIVVGRRFHLILEIMAENERGRPLE